MPISAGHGVDRSNLNATGRRGPRLLPLVPHPRGQGRRQETVEVAVQDSLDVAGLDLRPQVLHHLVGLHDVGADLVAPADVALVGLDRRRRRLALLQLQFVEPGLQHAHGDEAVAVLGAVLLRLDHDAGGDVGDADRALGLVDMLAAGAARAHGVDAEVAFLDLDIDILVHHRVDPGRGEAGVATGLTVVGRDAHEPVHAALGLQPAIGVVARDPDGGRFQAGLLAGALLDPLDLVAVLLGPARVHAGQHLRPVLRLGAAGAGMDLDVTVVGI